VAIVGAGAAGLATAIFTRRDQPTLDLVVVEGAKRPGAKILVSGGSRCNVTNVQVSERDFWGGPRSVVRRVLRALPVQATIAFFNDIGVPMHEEADGKLFPDSNHARDVLDALLAEADRVGVVVQHDTRVLGIAVVPEGFRLSTSRGSIVARAVVLATGGRSLPKSGSDGQGYEFAKALGHTIVPTTPALAPLLLASPGPKGPGLREALPALPALPARPAPPAPPDLPDPSRLSGISHDAELTVWIEGAVAERLRGSLLWTHFGISGPVALNASRHWARADLEGRRVGVTLNYCPGESFEAVDGRLVRLALERPRALILTGLSTFLPAAVAAEILGGLSIAQDATLAHMTREVRRRLAHALTSWPLEVSGTRGYTVAEATAGGVALDEIDPATMASRVCPGLYLVGEILDVDGRIGGFNFQWAWSSARAAARSLSRRQPWSPASSP
jgi:hypothetical protein